ncbi:hypothetical protein [Nonomuraea roseola]|uniref:Uncharacterized protein n=1 Tax=Nonomuraea roseola TaxID=46179 RepID=A0ABV5PWV8_9ACTN
MTPTGRHPGDAGRRGVDVEVRDLLGGRACRHGLPDRRFCAECEQAMVIVCENDCEPPSKAVGT